MLKEMTRRLLLVGMNNKVDTTKRERLMKAYTLRHFRERGYKILPSKYNNHYFVRCDNYFI